MDSSHIHAAQESILVKKGLFIQSLQLEKKRYVLEELGKHKYAAPDRHLAAAFKDMGQKTI